MRYKKIMIITIILACLLAVSTVSAANNATDDIISTDVANENVVSVNNNQVSVIENSTDNAISANDNNQVITEGNDSVGSFADLETEISNVEEGGVLNLTKDYKYVDGSTDGISINKPITIDGNGHTLDGNHMSKIFAVGENNVLLKNITFKNGKSKLMGGAMSIFGSNCNIVNCSFVENNAIHKNSVTYGGAIYLSCTGCSISNCSFINNYAVCGAAIFAPHDATNNKIIHCNFINNSGSDDGAIFWQADAGNIINCSFINNTGDFGAIYLEGEDCYIVDCNFINTTSKEYIGRASAIQVEGDNSHVINCKFISNGGIAVVWGGNNGNLSYSTFINNKISAFHWNVNNGNIIGCTLINNSYYNFGANFIKRSPGDLICNLSSFNYNNPSSYCAKLKDIINELVFNDEILFEFVNDDESKIFYIGLNKNNEAIIKNELYDLNVGTWNVNIIFEGNGNYYPCNATATITVLPLNSSVTVDDINASWDSETTFTAHVNSNNTLINEGTVSFYIADEFIGDASVINGTAVLTHEAPSTLGEHAISAIFNSINYLSSNKTAKLIVNSGDIDVSKYESVATFKMLSKLIENTPEGAILNLTSDYIYVSGSTEGISINKAITIDGQGHVLNGNNVSRVFKISSDNVILKNIYFEDTFEDVNDFTGAIYWLGNNGTMVNCSFSNIDGTSKTACIGAIHWSGNNGKLLYCNFSNIKTSFYGPIYWTGDNGTLSDCSFINNSCIVIGGGVCWNGNDGKLLNCIFINNSANSRGGAVSWNGNSGELLNCIFINNSASECAAIEWYGNDGYIFNSTFVNGDSSESSIGLFGKNVIIIKQDLSINVPNIQFYYKTPQTIFISLKQIVNDSLKSLNYKELLFNLVGDGGCSTFIKYTNGNGDVYLNEELVELGSKEWNVSVLFLGDDNYNPCNATATITVLPPSSSLTIADVNATVGHEITLVANVISSLTVNEGVVSFFDGETNIGESSVSNGTATLTYTPTTAGEHAITAIFNSNNYLSSNHTVNLFVNTILIYLELNDTRVSSNTTFLAKVTDFNGKPIDGGTVSFYKEGECLESVPIVDGMANMTFIPKDVGSYNIMANFDGSDIYYMVADSKILNVSQGNTYLIVEDINTTVNKETLFLVKVISDNNDVDQGGLIFYIDGIEFGDTPIVPGYGCVYYTPTDPGEHNITVKFSGYGLNYMDADTTFKLFVDAINIDLIAENTTVGYNNKFTAKLTTLSNETVDNGFISFYVDENYLDKVSIENGVAYLSYVPFVSGNHTLKAVYTDGVNFVDCEKSINYFVNKAKTQLIMSNLNGTVGHYIAITVNITSPINLTLNEGNVVFFDGSAQIGESPVSNGTATLTYAPATAGEHTITAIFNSSNYLSSNSTAKLLVDSASVSALVDQGIVGFNSTFVAEVKGLYSTINEGTVTFYINDEYLGIVSVENGTASISYIPSNANTYVVKAVFGDSDKFLSDEDSVSYVVAQADSNVIITDMNGTVGHDITITVNLVSSNNLTINEGYVIFFDGQTQIGESNVYDGVATLTYTPVTAGEHAITAMFYSTNYGDPINSALLNVSKADIDLSIDYIDSVYFTNQSNFAVNVLSNFKGVNEGTIKYYINGYYIGMSDVNEGKASTSFTTNTTGSFELLVIYNETDNYFAKNASTTFYVNQMPTTLTGESIIFDEQAYKTFTTELKDNNANGVYNQTVKIELIKYSGESATFTGVSDGNGITIYDVGTLAGGMWYVSGIYGGNENYIGSSFADKFIVVRLDTTTQIEEIQNPQVNHSYKLKANIHDENGKLVKEGIVQFFLDGVDIGSIDLSQNQGHQSALGEGVLGAVNSMFEYELGADDSDLYINYVPTKAGKHTLTAVYEGTTIYKSSNSTTSFEVSNSKTKETIITAPAVTTVYNGGKYLIITLKDVLGKAVSGVKLTVKFSNVKTVTSAATDKNGQVKISTNGLAPVKTYKTTITFKGNSKYDKSTKTVNVKVTKATPKLTASAKTFKKSVKTKSYTVTLKTNMNKVMSGKYVTLNVNKKTYKVKTNTKGQATFKINNLNKKGTFKAVVKYAGDKYYNTKTVNTKIIVK